MSEQTQLTSVSSTSRPMETTETSVVETTAGKLRGSLRDGIHSFKGVPYGDTTAGRNRFLPPSPVRPWTGIRDAFHYGPAAPQDKRAITPERTWIRHDGPSGEDCLVLNVYTPALDDGGKRPVMVYLHGGGYESGTSSTPGVEGRNLARHGDVVVVTLNHRLSVFGFLHLGALAGETYRDAGNAGMLDIIAALRWVRDNIERFGGDPGNVTIFGQSGGGAKVAILMAMPAARGLFHRAIIQSASSLLRVATPEQAARSAHGVLKQLGLKAADIDALQEVPADQLLAARRKAMAADGGVDNFRPVLDDRTLPTHPFHPTAPMLSAGIPLLIGSTETETSFPLAVNPNNFTMPMEEARERIALFVGTGDPETERLIAHYRTTHPGASPSDLFIAISTDHMYRRNMIRAAELKAAEGTAPVYMYMFTWRIPALDGLLKSPHTMCIPFVFGNVDAASAFTGTDPDRYPFMEAVMKAWIAFARSGDPNHGDLPVWKPYSATERATMVLDKQCRLVNDPAREDRLAIERCPPYEADLAFRRKF